MKYVISLVKQANQSFSCNLKNDKGQTNIVDINLRTLYDGLLVADLYVNGDIERLAVICNNKMPLLSTDVLGGNMYFNDLYGNENPSYDKFNDRFQLIYDTEYSLV